MKIKGFQGTSLLDYPGHIASLVFFGGCNLTCPFCHNPTLVLDPDQHEDYPVEALLQDLQERSTFVDGVVVTGGEPTLAKDLLLLLREIKKLGLDVKLDTNGLAPKVLKAAYEEKLVDFVALDLKTAPRRYGELHTRPVDFQTLLDTVKLIMEGEVDYEFRTTCVPGFVEEEDIRRIGETIKGAKRWALQQYAPGYALSETLQEVEPHPKGKIESWAELAKEYASEVQVRGL